MCSAQQNTASMFNGICVLAKTNKVTPIAFPDRQICSAAAVALSATHWRTTPNKDKKDQFFLCFAFYEHTI